MAPKTVQATLPIHAAHIRLHKSLDLHLFDAEHKFIAAIPLLDQMVTVWLVSEDSGPPFYEVSPDLADATQTCGLHFCLQLPLPSSSYYDPEEDHRLLPADAWKFRVGFKKDHENLRMGALAAIGTVDIADISVDPLPTGRSQNRGCNPLAWLFCPKPVSTQTGLSGKPENFPDSTAPLFSVSYDFGIYADKITDGAHHIRLGAFMGKLEETQTPEPYLFVAANPRLVGVSATMITL